MNAFEKIKERLEEESKFAVSLLNGKTDRYVAGVCDTSKKAIQIVSEAEAEYINKSTEHINKLSDCSTNADRIRAMSDEELADFLPIVSNMFCKPTDDCMKMICNRGECEKTKECALNWLKSPTTD